MRREDVGGGDGGGSGGGLFSDHRPVCALFSRRPNDRTNDRRTNEKVISYKGFAPVDEKELARYRQSARVKLLDPSTTKLADVDEHLKKTVQEVAFTTTSSRSRMAKDGYAMEAYRLAKHRTKQDFPLALQKRVAVRALKKMRKLKKREMDSSKLRKSISPAAGFSRAVPVINNLLNENGEPTMDRTEWISTVATRVLTRRHHDMHNPIRVQV